MTLFRKWLLVKGDTGRIEESLRDEDQEALREKVEAIPAKVPANDTFEGIDANSWLYWMQRAVEGGHARIVAGKFPTVDRSKATKDYILPPQQESPTQELTAAIREQTAAFKTLIEKL